MATKGAEDCRLASRDYSRFTVIETVRYIWTGLELPEQGLDSLVLEAQGPDLPSSFKIGHIAQASIALSALTAALFHSVRNSSAVPKVTVPWRHALAEFKSERLYLLDGQVASSEPTAIGGLHRTSNGYVRIHDGFSNHRNLALQLLGCAPNAAREQVDEQIQKWTAIDLENAAVQNDIVIAALRSYNEWDVLPQTSAISNFPIQIRQISTDGPRGLPPHLGRGTSQCLRGLKVLELSRVIAAPVAGKTLAAHGADVLWVTSPNLPDLPNLDRELGRGKRTVQLDLNNDADRDTLRQLAREADVFIQGYRPGSLASKGFSATDIAAINPGIIYGNMSAYGPDGPWSNRRGFDSIVQTCSGMNVSEAEHFGAGEPARPTPCQALDHASGYLLATGIIAALYQRIEQGGSFEVHVSLAGTMKYLRSLGQEAHFEYEDITRAEQVNEFMETRDSAFGYCRFVKHSAQIEGLTVDWDKMPKPLGSDEAVWLPS